jgi:hypothetical protein
MMGRDGQCLGRLVFAAALCAAGPSALAQEQPTRPTGAPPAGYPTGEVLPGAAPPVAFPAGACPLCPPAALPSSGTCPGADSSAAGEPPAAPKYRPSRFRADLGMGVMSPDDVNAYIKSKMPTDSPDRTDYSSTLLLLSAGASFAYYPAPFLGVRPHLVYLLGLREQRLEPGVVQTFAMHSLVPGLSLDISYDTGKLARYFVSPGISYQLAWFEGFSARGLGLSLALGAELTFGQARVRGMSIALVLRSAELPTTAGPLSSVPMRHLDFTSVLVCVGFQTGI